MKQPHKLDEVVAAGYAPSVRWLAEGIKSRRVPGRMIGRYWSHWVMTDEDLQEFLDSAVAPVREQVSEVVVADCESSGLVSGLSARSARRLRGVS